MQADAARSRSRGRAMAAGRTRRLLRTRRDCGSHVRAEWRVGCSAPTEGNVLSRTGESEHGNLAGRLRHDRHVDRGVASESPQSPSRVARPAASCAGDMAPVVRRHDDARPRAMAVHAVPPADDVGQRRHQLSQQSGHVLKPGDKRRRHVDTGGEHEREMGEHRHVGGLRLGDWTARLAEGDAVEPQEQPGKPDQKPETPE